MPEGRDRRELVDLLEEFLLGEPPSLTGNQLADEVGITFDEARLRWRSLGFTDVGADVPAFTHADLEALQLTQRLLDLGLIEPSDESALVRTLGRSFARLAEWQIGLLAKVVDPDRMSLEELRAVTGEVIPAVESLQSYVWRRHTLSAVSRVLLADPRGDQDADPDGEPGPKSDADAGSESDAVSGGGEPDGTTMGVGFADIVNYTRQSRAMSRSEVGRMVDHFEERALAIISAHGGRIIKTIGDEVLFVADGPADIGRIGLELVAERATDEDFPELRVGLAWGPALARLGDVLGPVVNLASRLTSTARPGTVLVDRALADELADADGFKVRRVRRTSVRGYRRLEPWSLRPENERSSGSGRAADPSAEE